MWATVSARGEAHHRSHIEMESAGRMHFASCIAGTVRVAVNDRVIDLDSRVTHWCLWSAYG